jgi:hypothetical protein
MTELLEQVAPIKADGRWRAALGVIGVAAGIAAWLLASSPSRRALHHVPDPPRLFDDGSGCPRTEASPRSLEEMARLRADRYPYDPRDGVLAVREYRRARDCYEVAGEIDDAARVDAAAIRLQARIETDYAAARMSLMRALDSERWTAALAEGRWLLRLTHHLGAHGYVEFLERIVGRATAAASAAP